MAAKGGVAGPDIFLSYNREDSARAKHFASAFAAEGFDVWWDVALRSGEAYDQVTEEALSGARAVVVLWSARSVVSRWVRAEATEAERNKTLLPVMIEPCKRPIMFELVQTADLSHWRGEAGDPAWQEFLQDVHNFVGERNGAAPKPAKPAEPAARPDRTSVVVLPFANMSGDPEQDYFADGISEDIITDLSKVSALMVIARNTAFTFKGRHVDIKDVARQLGVSHVLEGSVRKAGNRLRVTAQLIDGASGGHVWAERYDRELADIFDIQDEISEAIVGALKLKLLPEEKKAIEDRCCNSSDAYDHYIRARALRASMDFESVRKSVDAYRKALALDPDFALAWAGLASALLQHKSMFAEASGIAPEEIDQAFERAIALAPDRPEIVASRAALVLARHDWEGAEHCIAYFLARQDYGWSIVSHLMLALGRAQEAAEHQYRVWRADPLSVGASWALQYQLEVAGRIDEAEAEAEKSKDLPAARFPFEWRAMSRAMIRDDRDQVEQRLKAFADGGTRVPYAAELSGALDEPEEALRIVRKASEDPACKSPLELNGIAHWAAWLGDVDLAYAVLRRSVVEMSGNLLYDIWHPNFAGLRRDPRFKQLLVDVGLADHWRKTGNWGDYARPVGDSDFEITG